MIEVVGFFAAAVGGYLVGLVECRRRAAGEWEAISAAWDAVEDERRHPAGRAVK